MEIALGDLAGGESVRLNYSVEINIATGFPAREEFFLFFRNGWVRADGLADIRGDDPTTHARFDGTPTIFVVSP
ncbi:MAG: hypothetical protein ACOC98_14200 [Thermodesulfobacteriota bacterium]